MKLTTQGFYRVSVYTKDNKKEFKQYYVAADSIQEATVIVEDKLKEDNISDSVYINSILNTGQCLIRETEKEAELPLKNKDVTERIKTFEDAYNELGCKHPYCMKWDSIYQGGKNDNCKNIKDLIAYYKLRIIAAALNEGWKPNFMEDEGRYYPWFSLYTKDEYDELCEEDKSYVFRVDNNPFNSMNKYGGLVYVFVDSTISLSNSSYGSRIVFKTSELAKYAGRQFIDIYADFMNN